MSSGGCQTLKNPRVYKNLPLQASSGVFPVWSAVSITAMFSYRHAFHAGNHADVLKHTTLLALMTYLTQKDTALTVIDTHAGAGLDRLDGDYSQTSGEAGQGVLRLATALHKAGKSVTVAPALQAYLDLYRDLPIDMPVRASWEAQDNIPALQAVRRYWQVPDQPHVHRLLRQAFYALCTHVDHQLRIIWGTLREEDLLDDTVVLVSADHGDMLGHFGLWAKRLFYEGSSAIPMILVGAAGDRRVKTNHVDSRLVGLQDIMPTLLDLAHIPIPEGVEGLSMVSEQRREFFYGECREDDGASRMLHDGRYKLIWYPAGNHLQLFDLESDPQEQVNLATQAEHKTHVSRLSAELIRHLNGDDLQWVREGRLIGYPFEAGPFVADRAMSGQRGLHFPQPPMDPAATMVGAP